MTSAGIDLKQALTIVISEEHDPKLSNKLSVIENLIVSGQSLAMALQQSGLFSSYEYLSVKAGEETGRLNEVLHSLNQYYGARVKQNRQIKAALSYPAIILIFSFAVILFLLLVMIPMFQGIFSKFGGELPWLTRIVFELSIVIKESMTLLSVIFCVIVVLIRMVRKKEWFVKGLANVIRRVPFFGLFFERVALARFSRSMAFLISSKVPLSRCLQLQMQLVTYEPLRRSLTQVEQDVLSGISLYQSLARTKLFQPKFISMIKVGEEINQLDRFFATLYEQYTNETDFRVAQMNALLEPFLIIFLGFVVGFILLTMYLPMFQMSTTLSL